MSLRKKTHRRQLKAPLLQEAQWDSFNKGGAAEVVVGKKTFSSPANLYPI
jgi:hypothetical protein